MLQKYYGKDRAAKAIYGSILIFVFIAGVHFVSGESALGTALSIVVASITIVFAEVYAEFIGMTIKQRGVLSHKQALEIWEDTLAIASVSLVPACFFVLSNFKIFSISAAFFLSYMYCLSILFVFSYWASRLSGYGKGRSFVAASITLLIGLTIIWLKFMFGH